MLPSVAIFLLKKRLTLCRKGNFHAFLSSANFFSKSIFFEKFFQAYYQNVSLNSDQARHFVWPENVEPDLGENCLQRLSADGLVGKRLI